MQLAIIRHAIAEDGEDDAARPLSTRGRKRFAQIVTGLEALGERYDTVLHSPKLRALQTAELLAPLTKRLAVSGLLTSEPGDALLRLLNESSMAVVGHEPHLSALTAWLTTGDRGNSKAFEFKKGGVVLLSGTAAAGKMTVTALLPPRVLRRMRG